MKHSTDQSVIDNTELRKKYFNDHPEKNWKSNMSPEKIKEMKAYMKVDDKD